MSRIKETEQNNTVLVDDGARVAGEKKREGNTRQNGAALVVQMMAPEQKGQKKKQIRKGGIRRMIIIITISKKKIKDRHYSRGRSRPIMAKTAGGERRSVRRARAVLGGRPLSRKRRRPTDHCIVIRSLRPDFHRRFLRLNFIGARKPKKTNKKPIAIKACRGEEGNRRLLGTGASVRHRRCLCSIKLLALFAVFVCVYLGKRI